MPVFLNFGYDVQSGCNVPVKMDLRSHLHGAIVGGSGSGKSVALLYLIWQLLKIPAPLELYICDPKNSGDFVGIVPADRFATGMTESAGLIHKFYEIFQNTPEKNPVIKLLLIDEYAGLISSLPDIIGGKDGKAEVELLKSQMASMFMLSRSRGMGIWLIMQRPSASLFNSGSGALDNLMFNLNMGKLYTETHKSLFANEHFDDAEFAETYQPARGEGYFLQDGYSLKAVRMPFIKDVGKLSMLLQKLAVDKFGGK